MKIPIKFNKIGVGAKAIDEANMPLTFKSTAPSTVKLNATRKSNYIWFTI